MSIITKVFYKILITVSAITERTFNKVTQNPSGENEKVLFKILKKNSNCAFGIKFKFKDIKSIENYKEQVPLAEYADYENYIKRMAKGEKNILISEDVIYFGQTSGTTGKQKLIPITISSRSSTAKYILLLINRFAYNNFKKSWNYGRGLMIADIITAAYTEAGIPICAASSGGMKGIKGILPYLYTSPIEVMEIKDKKTALYLHLLFALKEDKLLCISGVFIPNILDLFRVLEDKHEKLIRDIKRGSISEDLNIDEAARKSLNKKLLADVRRAEQLENEFNKGNKGIIRRIWPNLSYISTITGANFSIYNDKVNYYTDSLPIYSRIYASTEGMIGINPYADKIRYVILPDAIFYEFIPIQEDKEENQYTVGLDDLEIGKKYEIVITNHAGLYRYRMGDVVKVVGFYNKSPEIEFLYRKNQVLNMVSEKTNEEHLTTSIRKTMEKLKLNIVDYTTAPDISVTPGRYIFYFELKEISSCNIEELEKILDDEIKNSNLSYGNARSNYKLAMVKVVLLSPNTFNLIKEYLINKGTSKDQVKIPRVVTNNKNILNIINENTAQ